MKELNNLIQQQFTKMCNTGKLFVSNIPGLELWKMYIESFPKKYDPIFRDPNSTEHNCNLCNNFIRRYGNIIALDEDNNIMTIWDIEVTNEEYVTSLKNMANHIKSSMILNVFIETYITLDKYLNYESCKKDQLVFKLGISHNTKRYTITEAEKFGVVKPNELRTFNHFHLSIPTEFIEKSNKSVESIQGEHRDNYSVFKRAMEEVSLDTLILVRDLINQDSLLDGKTHLYKVEEMIKLKTEYDNLTSNKDNWCWKTSINLKIAKFKNELIGVLCSDITLGVELNTACQLWNKRVDPINYMKTIAPITKSQIENTKKFVEENGYEESFDRRCATIEDIKVSEILHLNNIEKKSISIFDNVKSSSVQSKFDFNKIEEVSIDKFMSDILPTCTSVEAYLQNSHKNNLVTLTTANNKESKPIFKWSNNYSWTFNGNIAGKSELADKVIAKGGRVDGVFRFTHSWNEIERNQSLMDLHIFLPQHITPPDGQHNNYGNNHRIGWNRRTDTATKGIQDVDYTLVAPQGYIPVENITFPDINLMPEGTYTCKIHNWSFRDTGGRGKAEIAFGNECYQYIYPETRHKQWITIAKVTLKDSKFTIEHILQPLNISTNIYNLDTNNFHKVNLICLSPNHWDNNLIGNKFFFFMLENCRSSEDIRSFHNENLNSELAEHRKVIEVLGNTTKVKSIDNQLSGLGFNATVRDNLIVKLKGSFNRIIKIKF